MERQAPADYVKSAKSAGGYFAAHQDRTASVSSAMALRRLRALAFQDEKILRLSAAGAVFGNQRGDQARLANRQDAFNHFRAVHSIACMADER